MSAVFVTATGTDVGKTFVTTGLIRALRRAGREVEALKPVVSGFDIAAPAGSDPAEILQALGRDLSPATIAEISPWRFSAPLSPDMAARLEGRTVDFRALVDFCGRRIAAEHGALLVEGVGGIMVPLDDRHTVLDWMTALNLPILLVAGSYLGTISHTLTALDVLARRDLRVAALVISESAGSTVALSETIETLRNFVPAGLEIVTLPRLTGNTPDLQVFDSLAASLGNGP